MQIDDILKQVSRFQCNLVEITGGEPLIQNNTPQLIRRLLQSGYEVLLETNGSKDTRIIDPLCIKVVDIKCPSSRESASNNLNNIDYLGNKDQVKFVVQSRTDYEFAKEIIPKIPAHVPGHHILFSPVVEKLQPSILAEWMLEDHLQARLQLQLHKLIWPDKDRGV